ncbi:hypothetical protein KFK09_010228 [Dendrobium nobile]|uniref:Disease resistance protein winged helix domain-containing protein n=1 Tax=Dendrobium nobile TaxID=94219 RepID=A0A8T3BNS2_DENNO|nr:hypothetical protein KFK09_010228 [Dendrobium nobile]
MFLPKHLQNCFAFCCIFPQDHWFDKDDLVRMWIASGFILLPCIRGEAAEDIGGSQSCGPVVGRGSKIW